MHLARRTDYALRVLIYLSVSPSNLTTVAEIASTYDISQNHLVKVVKDLVARGYVRSFKGRGGGIVLGRDAATITLGEVVRSMEPNLVPVDCRGCAILPGCALPGPLSRAVAAFLAVLDSCTLADVSSASGDLGGLLGLDHDGGPITSR